MNHPQRAPNSEPRCPDWCREEGFEALAQFLREYGGSFSCEDSPPLSSPVLSPHLYEEVNTNWRRSPVETEREAYMPGPHPNLSVSTATRFAPKITLIYEPLQPSPLEFECAICGPSTMLQTAPPKSRCGHYVSCSECQTRIVRQLLRCTTCCLHLVGDYPACGPECEVLSSSFGQVLQTGNCPRCGDKLAKDICGDQCHRKSMEAYKSCHDRLMKEVAAMVLHPRVCQQLYPTARPCCHYSRCHVHGTVSRGRSQRCPDCRAMSRAHSREGKTKDYRRRSSQ